MKISELISHLENLKNEHGDLPIAVPDAEGDPQIYDIDAEVRKEKVGKRDGKTHYYEVDEDVFIF
jgi:hypothetical protein